MTTELQTPILRLGRRSDSPEIDLAPLQGLWPVEMYLKLTEQTSQLIEFTDGEVEILPMPTKYHQAVSLLLLLKFLAWVRPVGGVVFYAPLRLQIRPGKFREPDLLLLRDANDPRNQDAFWLGADLVVEIVCPDDPERDTVTKRADYAEAGIPEYWIVNPLESTITVLALESMAYAEHGVFARGVVATSHLLEGFQVSVDEVFDAA